LKTRENFIVCNIQGNFPNGIALQVSGTDISHINHFTMTSTHIGSSTIFYVNVQAIMDADAKIQKHSIVAIGNPERYVRKASHRGSK